MNTERRKWGRDEDECAARPAMGVGGGGSEGSPAPARSSAQVILIPKQLRMEWTDLMALDTALSDLALRVAAVIGYHLNRHRGDTYLTQESLAALTGRAERSIRRALEELEGRGYLIVDRRTLGTRKSDGRLVAGGKGVANTYAPAVDHEQVAATTRGLNLADRCAAVAQRRTPVSSSGETKEDSGDLLCAPEVPGDKVGIGGQESPPHDAQRRTLAAPKEDTGVLPTLSTLPSEANPSRARAAGRAREAARHPRHPHQRHPLGPAAEPLCERLGKEAFALWFNQARLVMIEGEVATVTVPQKFVRERIEREFLEPLIGALRKASPSVRRVALEVRP